MELAILSFLLVTVALARMVLARRRAVVADILTTLAAAMRQHLPLPAALDCSAWSLGRSSARALHRISIGVAQGLSLAEAIRAGYRFFPAHPLGLIAAAEPTGRLAQAMECLEAEYVLRPEGRSPIRPANLSYALLILAFVCALHLLLMIFVLPRLRDIFADISSTVPPATEAVFSSTGWFSLALLILAVLIIGGVVEGVFRTRRLRPARLGLYPLDLMRWYVPILAGLERERSRLRVVEWLRMALEGGQDLESALSYAMDLDMNAMFRRRIDRWLDLLRQGHSASDAARNSGVGQMVAWAMDERIHGGNALNAMRMLETMLRCQVGHRARVFQSVLMPLLVLLLACGVGFIVCSLILPLTQLHNAVMTLPR